MPEMGNIVRSIDLLRCLDGWIILMRGRRHVASKNQPREQFRTPMCSEVEYGAIVW